MGVAVPEFDSILVEAGDDHVVTVTLNRPKKLNTFNQTVMDDFKRLWHWCSYEDGVHAVVIRAAGDRAFSSGVDVVEGFFRPDEPYHDVDPGTFLSPKANRCWKPVVCAVHGIVAGGAMYWVNEADILIAGADAQFFDPHVTYGLTAALEPIGLSRRMPLGEVLRMALLGNDERISARRALEIGLISEILPDKDRLWERAHELAAKIAEKPPLAVQGTLRAIWESLDTGRTHALQTAMSYTQLTAAGGARALDPKKLGAGNFEVR